MGIIRVWRRLACLLLCGLALGGALAQEGRNLTAKAAAVAPTERRVALVIGNSEYAKAPLSNPVNDATDIAAKLRGLGFDVVERRDLKTSQIGRTLREFRSKLTAGAVALVFYAGHGLQIKGENFLPTVDADIEGEEDVPNQSLSLRQLLEMLDENKTRLNLVFLDACRNNPFSRKFRSVGDGLARVSAPSGTLISFATRPGSVASDGEGRNGVYTTQLLKVMDTPNQPIEQALKRVVSGVKAASKGAQEPWMEGSIEGDFYFLQRAEALAAPSTPDAARAQQVAIDRAVEEAVRRSNEQAAKERAELQAQMERLIKQTLAQQNARIEAERQASAAVAMATPAAAKPTPPQQLAMLQPSAAASREGGFSGVVIGDEWEYESKDKLFGKNHRMVFRVKGLAKDAGVLEEVLVDGKPVLEWVFNKDAAAISVPVEAEFVFAPHWSGGDLPQLRVHGPGYCTRPGWHCQVALTVRGQETVDLPAGRFEAIRLDGFLTAVTSGFNAASGRLSIWYAKDDRRLLKQQAVFTGRGLSVDETIELVAKRPAGR